MKGNQTKNKNLIEGIIIYAIGSFGTKILSFLIVPLYTYYISMEDIGVYDLLNTTVNLLAPIITLQISDAAFRWMIRGEDSEYKYIKSTIQVFTLNSIIATLLIVIIEKKISFPYSKEFIFLLVTSMALTTIQKLLRGLKNQRLYVISSVLYTVIFLILNVLQICVLKQGIYSLFTSAIIANIVSLAIAFILEKRLRINFFTRLDGKTIHSMLKFSIPLIPNQLNWWVMNSSDRYIIKFFLGTAANGLYAISYKFPSMLQLLLGFFNTSWQDVSVADKDICSGKYYTKIFKQLYRFSFSLLWLLIPITKIFIQIVMSSDYKNSANYISFLYIGTVFQSFSSFYGVGYLRDKNTKQASLTSIYGALINAVVNIIFIKFIGLHAASVSTFFGFLIMWLMREKQNREKLDITIDKYEFVTFFVLTLIVCMIACFSNFYVDIIMGIIGSVCFIIVNKSVVIQLTHRILKKQ